MRRPGFNSGQKSDLRIWNFAVKWLTNLLIIGQDHPSRSPWEDGGANSPRSHVQAHEGEKDDCEQPAWTYQGQIMPDQPDCVLWWGDWLRKQEKTISKALDTVSHSTVVVKLGRSGLGGWTTRLVKKSGQLFEPVTSYEWHSSGSDKGADTV